MSSPQITVAVLYGDAIRASSPKAYPGPKVTIISSPGNAFYINSSTGKFGSI